MRAPRRRWTAGLGKGRGSPQPDAASVDVTDALREEIRRDVFRDDAGNAQSNRRRHLVFRKRLGQENGARGERRFLHFAEHRQSFPEGGRQIEKQNIRPVRSKSARNVLSLSTVRDDGEVLLQGEEPFQTGEHDRVVAGQHQAYRLLGGHLRFRPQPLG